MVEAVGDGLESGNIREDVGEASEEELGNVREQLAKAAQIRTQLAQAQVQQGNYAQMLTLLLTHVQDGALLKAIFHHMQELHIPLEFVFAQFYPGLANREDLSWFTQAYPELEYQELSAQQITPFVAYTRSLREQSALKTLTLEEYIPFLIRLMVRSGLVDMTGRDAEKQESFKASLRMYLG